MTALDPLAVLDAPVDSIVTLDFETFYGDDFTLSKMTTESYVRDPRFEVIGVGVKVDHGPTVWTDAAGLRAWARRVDWERTALLAHHAHFDGLILSHHFGIRPAFWFDTLSMARALHGAEVGGSLEKLAIAYGAGEKGHEVLNAKGKHLADFTPAELDAYAAYCRNDVDLTRRIFDAMLAAGFPELELYAIDATVRMFTEPTFHVDEALLREFLTWEQKRKADLLARVLKDRSDLSSNDRFAAILEALGVDVPKKASPTRREADGTPARTFAFAKSDPGMQALLEHPRDEVRWLAEARIAVKSTINETRTERMIRAGANGRAVPVYLKFYGAHTGRWSGADRMNFQNLERVPKKIDPEKPYAGTLRKALLAPEDHDLVVADSNAIEARMLAWIAGHAPLVEGFARNQDVYSAFASRVYQRPIDRKKNPADETPGFVGKVAILGLGYQMGWLKFGVTLAAGPMGAKPIIFTAADAEALKVDVGAAFLSPEEADKVRGSDGRLSRRDKARADRYARVASVPSRLPMRERLAHFAVAHYLVGVYRDENRPIVEWWDAMGDVLDAMVDGRETAFGPADCLQTARHGIRLPNGMVMRYPGLKRSRGGHEAGDDGRCERCERAIDPHYGRVDECPRGPIHFSYVSGHGKEKVHIYGGLLTENIVQALARIVVAEQMLYVRGAYGYHVTTTTHDEIVLCVPKAEAGRATERLISAMKTAPKWAQGLPLNAEGAHARSYGAAK